MNIYGVDGGTCFTVTEDAPVKMMGHDLLQNVVKERIAELENIGDQSLLMLQSGKFYKVSVHVTVMEIPAEDYEQLEATKAYNLHYNVDD